MHTNLCDVLCHAQHMTSLLITLTVQAIFLHLTAFQEHLVFPGQHQTND